MGLELIEDGTLLKYSFEDVVFLPDGVKEIKSYTFARCISIKEIIIPDSVQIINDNAFCSTGLKSIVIPDSVAELGSKAFEHCRDLQTVIIGKGITALRDYTFRYCNKLTHIELPAGLQRVGYHAFEECYALKTVWVDGVEYQLRDKNSPKPVKLVFESLEQIRERIWQDYKNGLMDEFEYVDYEIAGDGYEY